MFVVYVLQNPRGRRYIGQTADAVKRLRAHNDGKVFSTRAGGPWKMIFTREFSTRSLAVQYEKRLKKAKGGNGLREMLTANEHCAPA